MTEYHLIFLEGLARAVVACCVVFGFLPRLMMLRMFPEEPWRNRAGNALAMGAFLIVMVHVLVYAKLNDSVSFAVFLGCIIVVRLWYLHFRVSDRHLKNHLASLLRFLDSNSVSSVFRFVRIKFVAMMTRWTPMEWFYALLLGVVLVLTGFIRALPAWNHAAPFSVEYYETLEKVKQLQINQMYTEGYRVPLGLPIAAQVLALFSQVNSALLLHFLGVLSSVFMAASICYVVYRSTFSIEGGIIGAAVFGLFSALLPLDVRHQVEADSLVLATAFALPALSFFAEFCAEGNVRSLIVAIAGVVAATAINLFIGCFAAAGIILVLVGSLLYAFRFRWMRGIKLMSMTAATVLLAAGSFLFFRAGMRNENLKNALEILLYDKHLNRYFSMYAGLSPLLHEACLGLFGLLAVFSLFRYGHRSAPLQLLSWGLIGGGTMVLLPYSYKEILSYIPFSQVAYVLSIVLAVGAGIVVSTVGVAGSFLVRKVRGHHWVSSGWKLSLAAVALFLCWKYSPPQKVNMEFTAEPDGFATSLYLIEQQFMPYQWTVVSHRGTALSGMNRGRFMDYEYFVERYNPLQYKHGTKEAVPTPLLFFFVERAHQKTEIMTELSTTDRNAEQKMKEWLNVYAQNHRDLKVFYSDDKVIVYEIRNRSFNVLRG